MKGRLGMPSVMCKNLLCLLLISTTFSGVDGGTFLLARLGCIILRFEIITIRTCTVNVALTGRIVLVDIPWTLNDCWVQIRRMLHLQRRTRTLHLQRTSAINQSWTWTISINKWKNLREKRVRRITSPLVTNKCLLLGCVFKVTNSY